MQDKSKLPDGLKIRGKSIALDWSHRESFRPITAPNQHSFQAVDGREVMHWDTSTTVGVWTNSTAPPPSTQPDASTDKPAMVNDAPAVPPPRSAPSSTAEPEEVKIEAPAASFAPSEAPSVASTAATSFVIPSSAPEPEPAKLNSLPTPNAAADKIASPPPTQPKLDRAAAPPIPPQPAEVRCGSPGALLIDQSPPTLKRSINDVEPEDSMFFADTVKMTCWLCLRQFRTIDDIERHNSLSNLHKVR